MPDELKIVTRVDASGVGPGVEQTVAGLKQIETATTQAGTAAQAGAAQATQATEAQIAAQAKAAAIAREYGVSLQTAAAAMQMLGVADGQVVLGSAELEAALETVQAQLERVTEAQAALTAGTQAALDAQATVVEQPGDGGGGVLEDTGASLEASAAILEHIEHQKSAAKEAAEELEKKKEEEEAALEKEKALGEEMGASEEATEHLTAARVRATEAGAELTEVQQRSIIVAHEYGVSMGVAVAAVESLANANAKAVIGSAELEEALDSVQMRLRKVAEGFTETDAAARATTEALLAEFAAMDEANALTEKVGAATGQVSAALARFGLTEAEVAAQAQKMGISFEVAARAMLQIKQAALADEVKAAREAMEAATVAATATAVAHGEVSHAVEEAAEKTEVKFGRGSPAFHAMVAASNVSRGGAVAMRGWMEAAELAGVAFGGWVGPLILVSALVAEFSERWEESNRKVGEGKEKVDDLATATETYKKALDALLAPLKAIEASDEVQLRALHDKQTLAQRQIELDKATATERARSDYLAAYGSAKTPEERKRLTEQFEATKQDIAAGSTVASAQLEVKSKEEDIAAQQQALEDQKKTLATQQGEFDQKQREADLARAVLASQNLPVPQTQEEIAAGAPQQFTQGIQLTDKGELPEGATGPAQAVVDDLQRQLEIAETGILLGKTPEWQERLKSDGYDPDQVQATLVRQVADLTERLKNAQGVVDAINAAPGQIKVGEEAADPQSGLKAKIDEQANKVAEGTEKLSVQQAELAQAQQALTTSIQTAADDQVESQQKAAQQQADEDAKAARAARDKELEAQTTLLEARLEGADASAKSALQAQIEKLNEEKAANKANDQIDDAIGIQSETDFTDRFNTKLTPEQEAKYQEWLKKKGLGPGESYDYDMRGAWLNNAQQAENGHFPDTFKKPNHPTFSNQSIYSGVDGYVGGKWSEDDDPNRTYQASSTNLQMHSLEELQDYFNKKEPDYKLVAAPTIQAIRDEFNAEIAKLRAQLAEAVKKDNGKESRAEDKQTEEQIKIATQTIEKSGSNTAIAQLQNVLASHLSDLQELPILMQIIANAHLTLRTEVGDLKATVERLKHP